MTSEQRTLVSDEMVDRALAAWDEPLPNEIPPNVEEHVAMRAALEAVEEGLVGAWWERLGEERSI